jgi:hypothetical protein
VSYTMQPRSRISRGSHVACRSRRVRATAQHQRFVFVCGIAERLNRVVPRTRAAHRRARTDCSARPGDRLGSRRHRAPPCLLRRGAGTRRGTNGRRAQAAPSSEGPANREVAGLRHGRSQPQTPWENGSNLNSGPWERLRSRGQTRGKNRGKMTSTISHDSYGTRTVVRKSSSKTTGAGNGARTRDLNFG